MLLVLIAATTLLIAAYGIIIEPLYLSPFSRVPGPKLYAITKWRLAWEDWIGPNEVHFNSLMALRTIYGPGSGFGRTNFYRMFDVYGKQNLFTFHSAKDHGERKKLLANAYSKSNVIRGHVAETVSGKIQDYLRLLKAEGDVGGAHEIFTSLHYYSLDSITQFLYGHHGVTQVMNGDPASRSLLVDILDGPGRRRLTWFVVHIPALTKWLYTRADAVERLAKPFLPMQKPSTYTGIRAHALKAMQKYTAAAAADKVDDTAKYTIIGRLYQSNAKLSNLEIASEYRWLDDPEHVSMMKKWWWAFSSGGRMCIGSNLALAEMALVPAIYRKYRTKLTSGEQNASPGITSRSEVFGDETFAETKHLPKMPPKGSRLLKELRHMPVTGRSMFENPDIASSQTSMSNTQNNTQPSQATLHVVPTRKRRKVKAVPPIVLDQCTICLEEQLYSNAFALLSSSLNSGPDVEAPACVPPVQHLALASTIAIHPSFTSRTESVDKHAAAEAAMGYLRNIANTTMIEETGLKEALRFGVASSKKARTRRASTRQESANGTSDEEDNAQIRSQYADKQSLAENAEDFWAVVGWAFNCSVIHKTRWIRWQMWLDLVLDVIEADLDAWAPEQTKLPKGTDLSSTLLAQYLFSVGAGRQNTRRVMRAITADGSAQSLAQFPEIWNNETRPPKKKQDERLSNKRKLDLDNEEYGDYFDDESGEESPDSKSRSSRSGTTASKRSRRSGASSRDNVGHEDRDSDETPEAAVASTGIDSFGGTDSIRIRQRFLSLLTRFSRAAPALFVDTEELFALFTEFIRPLPLTIFQQFVLPMKPYLNSDLHASFNEMLFRPLIGASSCKGIISQQEFEASFAHRAASNTSVVDNAKVSLLTESLLRALWQSDCLDNNLSGLKTQVEKGVQARNQKIAGDGRKKAGKKAGADVEGRSVLQSSADRMSVLLTVLAG
ncbi:hypothetical protein AC578_10737 [Pseudocercospora eumusae]|uniref:Cytochrome P450 n=1 Tax=Pseudocercospora eumusae TaxID=321146 RepID=A0A139H4Q3_9PEZI|nr:hypothetical protein AC578_10737 [Pseudocercospora eumusae]